MLNRAAARENRVIALLCDFGGQSREVAAELHIKTRRSGI
jgi:hypothetical protein